MTVHVLQSILQRGRLVQSSLCVSWVTRSAFRSECVNTSVCLNDGVHLHKDKNMSHIKTRVSTPWRRHNSSKTEVGVSVLKKNETHMYGHVLCGTVSVVSNDHRGSVSRLAHNNNAWTEQHRHQHMLFMDYHVHMLRH